MNKDTFNKETLNEVVNCIQKSKRNIRIAINNTGNGESSVTIEKMRLIPDDLIWLNQLK